MPSVSRPGKAGTYVELPAELKAEFAAFARSRGTDFVEQLVLAMRRHLAFPPPVADLTPAGPEKISKKKKKSI